MLNNLRVKCPNVCNLLSNDLAKVNMHGKQMNKGTQMWQNVNN